MDSYFQKIRTVLKTAYLKIEFRCLTKFHLDDGVSVRLRFQKGTKEREKKFSKVILTRHLRWHSPMRNRPLLKLSRPLSLKALLPLSFLTSFLRPLHLFTFITAWKNIESVLVESSRLKVLRL